MGAKETLEALRYMQPDFQGEAIRQPNTELNALSQMTAQQNKYNPVAIARQIGDMPLAPNMPSSYSVGEAVNVGANMLPFIGDAQAIADAKMDYQKGNYGMAAFNAATALPVVGDVMSAAKIGVPTAMGIGGILSGMARRSGKMPVTPFSKEAGILGGAKAKTADLNALNQAQEMTKSGVSRDKIWADTGWFKGVDDKWKFEIDDSRSKYAGYLMEGSEAEGVIGDLVKHEDLYKGYPELADISASYGKGSGGSLTGDMFGERNIRFTGLPEKGIAQHELQHAVQEGEGFARGGSTAEFSDTWQRDMHNKNYLESQKTDKLLALRGGNEYKDLQSQINQTSESFSKDKSYGSLLKRLLAKRREMERVALGGIDYEIAELANKTLMNPLDKYKSLAGETEARAVQTRLNMSPQQRIDRPFWMDYDVPESKQVVKY